MSATYWVAQLIEDVFRNEPRNVGVLVNYNGAIAARFLGEVDELHIDGRKLRGLSHPDVFKQWVTYWRRTLGSVGEIDAIVRTSSANYRVVQAGEVSDIGADAPEDVANYLYGLLVSEGGFREAIGVELENSNITLETDLSQEFRQRYIFADQDPQIRHPIQRGATVLGSDALAHKPAFVQENGVLYVMETVDFTIYQKRRSRDHAGLSAYMFKDIRATHANAETIAIVKVADTERDVPDVEYGMRLLGNEGRIVEWQDQAQKRQFLNERVDLAHR